MRKIHFIIAILFLNLFQLYGQGKSADSLEINKIDRIVEKTLKDSTIQKVGIEKLKFQDFACCF